MTTGRAWDRIREGARRRPELAVLAGLLVLGLIARIYFLFTWSPALTGYSDSGIYFQDAYAGVWTDPIRTVGYGMFLAALHWVTPHLLLVTIVQHAMGLVAAVVWFLIVRRIGGPSWLGLIPAGIVAIGGDELFIEHAALSETLYILLLSLAVYFAVRARDGALGWAAAGGACLGFSVWDRAAGIALVLIVPLWLLFGQRRHGWSSLAPAAISLAVAVALIGVYVGWRGIASGHAGLTTNGNWNLYGRVAPWADCTKFTPPSGTEALCDPTPPSQRMNRNDEYYIYTSDSPAWRLLGPPYLYSSYPDAMGKLERYSFAAIRGQPLDYLDAVWQDAVRIVDPDHHSYGALSAQQLIDYLQNGPDFVSGQNDFVASWQDVLYPGDAYAATHRGDMQPLRNWERLTRFDGVWMVILLALCLAAPWVVPGRARSGARLLAAITLTLLLFPLFTKGYDYRFVIPALAPLFATAALSGWGVYTRVLEARRRRL